MGDGDHRPWRQATNDALVERLIEALQRATVTTVAADAASREQVDLPAPELATALLNLLASVLGSVPQCQTPAGTRKLSEAAGKELLVLMRAYRELTHRDGREPLH